jgi:hypothetical protein
MSHTSVGIASFLTARPRYSNSAKGTIDVLSPKPHVTIDSAAIFVKRELSSETTPGFASEVIFKFPQSGYVSHAAIRFDLAQTTTADYSDYPAMSIIDRVELRAENEILHQYDYDVVVPYMLAQLNDEEAIDKVLLASGGVNVGTTAAFSCFAWIPCFFDPIIAPNVKPLNLGKFKKPPSLKIVTRSLANSVKPTSTNGTVSTMKMIIYMTETSIDKKTSDLVAPNQFHKSIDFYTLRNKSVASATETEVDISDFRGLGKKLYINTRTVADVDTNKQYFSFNEIDVIKSRLDGAEETIFNKKEEGELDFIFFNHAKGFSTTLGYPYIVNFHYAFAKGTEIVNSGGVHSQNVNKNTLLVTHSTGSPEYISVCGIRSCMFKYDMGSMVRLI